jgi:hypothetical protein
MQHAIATLELRPVTLREFLRVLLRDVRELEAAPVRKLEDGAFAFAS